MQTADARVHDETFKAIKTVYRRSEESTLGTWCQYLCTYTPLFEVPVIDKPAQ